MSVNFHNVLNQYLHKILTQHESVNSADHLPLHWMLYIGNTDITDTYFNLPNGLEIASNAWNIYRTDKLIITNTQTFDFGNTNTAITNQSVTHILKDTEGNNLLSFDVNLTVGSGSKYKIPINGLSIELSSNNTVFSEKLYKYIFLGELYNTVTSWWVQLIYNSDYSTPRIALPKDNFSPIYKNKTGLYCITAVFNSILIPVDQVTDTITRIELWDSEIGGNKLFETETITAGVVYIDYNKYLEFNNFTIVLPNDALTNSYLAPNDSSNILYIPLTAYLEDINNHVNLLQESVSLTTDLSADSPTYVVSYLDTNAELSYTAPTIPEYFTWIFYIKLLNSANSRKFIYINIPNTFRVEYDSGVFYVYLNNVLYLTYNYSLPINVWHKCIIYRTADNDLVFKIKTKNDLATFVSVTLPEIFSLNTPSGNMQINSTEYPLLGYASLIALYNESNTLGIYDVPNPYKTYIWNTLTLVDWLKLNYTQWTEV